MITAEQKQELTDLLSKKNLPLDLKIEILDHLLEQADYKMDFEDKDFNTSLEEIKTSWQTDLKMGRRFFWEKSTTKIHRDILRKTDSEILKKSLPYFVAYLVISISLIFYNKSLASNFIFTINSVAVIVFCILFLFNFKILKSASSPKGRNNISYLQKRAYYFLMANMMIPILVLFDFDNRFDKYYFSLMNLVNNNDFTQILFGSFLIFNTYSFIWIYGYHYFVEYKKSVRYLEDKIDLKL